MRCKYSLVDLFEIDLQCDSRVIATRFTLPLSIGNTLIGRLAATDQLTCGICDRYLVKITIFCCFKTLLVMPVAVFIMQISKIFCIS